MPKINAEGEGRNLNRVSGGVIFNAPLLNRFCSVCSGFSELTKNRNIILMFGVVFGGIVEKLCESVRESLWENGGKECGKNAQRKKVVEKAEFYTQFGGRVEKFSKSFPRLRTPVKWWFCTLST